MTIRTGLTMAALAVLCLGTTPLAAQSITGVSGETRKSWGATDPVVATLDMDWTSWSHDVLVARFVHQPVKVMGLGPLEPEERVALKRLVGGTEASARAVLGLLEDGRVDAPYARDALEGIIVAFHRQLAELAER